MKLENIDSRLEAPGVAISANPEISREALEEAVPVSYVVNESDWTEPAVCGSPAGCKGHKGKKAAPLQAPQAASFQGVHH